MYESNLCLDFQQSSSSCSIMRKEGDSNLACKLPNLNPLIYPGPEKPRLMCTEEKYCPYVVDTSVQNMYSDVEREVRQSESTVTCNFSTGIDFSLCYFLFILLLYPVCRI